MTIRNTLLGTCLAAATMVAAFPGGAHEHGNAEGKMADKTGGGTVEHIVLFRFKEEVSDADVQEVVDRFVALEASVRDGEPYILDIQYGTQNSVEGVARGYEVGFIVSFKNLDDRDFYVGKPFIDGDDYDREHDAFKAFVGPLLAEENGVLVFDFADGDATTPPVE